MGKRKCFVTGNSKKNFPRSSVSRYATALNKVLNVAPRSFYPESSKDSAALLSRRASLGGAVNRRVAFWRLLQLGVFGFGFLEDRDVGVGVFPEREKIFVGGERADAGGIGIRALRGLCLQSVRASHSQMRQRSRPAVPDDAAVVENLLKLNGGRTALSGCKVC